jgi:hypothetical protein
MHDPSGAQVAVFQLAGIATGDIQVPAVEATWLREWKCGQQTFFYPPPSNGYAMVTVPFAPSKVITN